MQFRQEVQQLRSQGLSYPQIAKAVGAAVGTVWNAINKLAPPLQEMATQSKDNDV